MSINDRKENSDIFVGPKVKTGENGPHIFLQWARKLPDFNYCHNGAGIHG